MQNETQNVLNIDIAMTASSRFNKSGAGLCYWDGRSTIKALSMAKSLFVPEPNVVFPKSYPGPLMACPAPNVCTPGPTSSSIPQSHVGLTKRQLSSSVARIVIQPLLNTGMCETSLGAKYLINTGSKANDDKMNNRLGVLNARESCAEDAQNGDAEDFIDGYLKSLQEQARKEVELLAAMKSVDNNRVIAQLKQKFNLSYAQYGKSESVINFTLQY